MFVAYVKRYSHQRYKQEYAKFLNENIRRDASSGANHESNRHISFRDSIFLHSIVEKEHDHGHKTEEGSGIDWESTYLQNQLLTIKKRRPQTRLDITYVIWRVSSQ